MRKLFTLFFVLMFGVGMASAQSGTCDDGLTWTLSDGVLTISGIGAMDDYYAYPYAPWYTYRSSITSVIINDGVTSIGKEAFKNTALYNNEDNWENNVLYVGNCLIAAKGGISGDYVIKEGVSLIADAAFLWCTKLSSLTLPNSITNIGDGVFFRVCRSGDVGRLNALLPTSERGRV